MAPRYDVREVQDRGHYWQVVYDVTYDNGFQTEHGHSIPKDTPEWRAAEYDLDPVGDFELILDIILAEPYIAPEEAVGAVPEEDLHGAPSIAIARSKHISRCARAKLKYRISTRKKNGNGAAKALVEIDNPFDVIRYGAVIDQDVVAIKKEHVRRTRSELARRKQETAPERALRVAEELGIDMNRVQRGLRNG